MQTILSFLAALAILVTIHELGHYWAARWCGVKVLRFSVGMGKPIWRWQKSADSTEWTISALPLGGYVKMLDERESDTPIPQSELPFTFNRQTVWKRAFIVFSGPLANFLLAIAIYLAFYLVGVQEPAALLGKPPVQSVAEQAGIKGGERVVAIEQGNQRYDIQSWTDLRWQLMRHNVDQQLPALVVKDQAGKEKSINLPGQHDLLNDAEQDFLKKLGLVLQVGPVAIQEIMPNSAAEKAGLKVQDTLLAVDGIPSSNTSGVVQLIKSKPGQKVNLTILRDGQTMQSPVILDTAKDKDNGQAIGKLGAAFAQRVKMDDVRYPFLQAAQRSWLKVWEMSEFSLRMMGRMLIGQASLKNISGPLSIADYAGKAAHLGVEAFLGFLALISISLGVLNLLPIPILDGGHLLYYCVEILFGKPMPINWQEKFQKVGLVCILLLGFLAIFNDLNRYLGQYLHNVFG